MPFKNAFKKLGYVYTITALYLLVNEDVIRA